MDFLQIITLSGPVPGIIRLEFKCLAALGKISNLLGKRFEFEPDDDRHRSCQNCHLKKINRLTSIAKLGLLPSTIIMYKSQVGLREYIRSIVLYLPPFCGNI